MPYPPEGVPRPNAPPSPRQREVLVYITETCQNDGRAPTLREIGGELEISFVTVYEHVRVLVRKGWLTNTVGKRRQYSPLFDLDEEEAASATMFFADP